MKLIFLDIDGVLNSEMFASRKMEEIEEKGYGNSTLKDMDPFCIANLNMITSKTGAKIVLSSSWRFKYTSIEEARQEFEFYGIEGELVDRTPRLDYEGHPSSPPRGCEIDEWIKMNGKVTGKFFDEYNEYAILDDDDDMLLKQYENFFRIEPYIGLTPHRAEDVIKFLGEQN